MNGPHHHKSQDYGNYAVYKHMIRPNFSPYSDSLLKANLAILFSNEMEWILSTVHLSLRVKVEIPSEKTKKNNKWSTF